EETPGHEHVAVVAVELHPRGQPWAAPYRRTAPGAAVVEHSAELPGAADGHPPPAVQLNVGVGTECPLLRQAARRPVLPPVEIPVRLLKHTVGVVVEVQPQPVVPALLVGPEQKAQVVDFESRRASQVARLEV